MKTAVEWLVENLDIIWEEKIIDLVEQAKEMEKKQKKCYHPLSERKYTSDTHFECTICGDNNY
jgi:hypothetical protein